MAIFFCRFQKFPFSVAGVECTMVGRLDDGDQIEAIRFASVSFSSRNTLVGHCPCASMAELHPRPASRVRWVEYNSRYHFGMARVEAYGLKHSSLLMGSTFLAGQYNWVGASQSLRISIKHKSTARPFAVLRKIRFFLSSPRHYHLFSQSQSLSYLFLIFLCHYQ
jgi:hypothetical protein